ncbi:MAG: hypothetical protein QG608_371 [Actinomycetota bacterium]|nr:hypothetical protein [Actinomycetota bacterium]
MNRPVATAANSPGAPRRPRGPGLLLRWALPLAIVAAGAPAAAAPSSADSPTKARSSSTSRQLWGEALGSAADSPYLSARPGPGRFPLVERGKAVPIAVSTDDHPGVVRVVGDLKDDIHRVTGTTPTVHKDTVPQAANVVLIGTIGKSPLIDGLIKTGKINVSGLAGKWETSLEQVVENPLPGVRRAFVIAGSDQRGTIYGAYDVSEQMGVSPWYWWDDVVPAHQDALYVLPGRHTQGTPAVKYRGFFVNDENPSLGTWAPKFFGKGHAPGFEAGFNKEFYSKIFEVMLRLKANYLWPAVWGRAFAEDDPQNHETATAYGVVMGTSHEAPMMRGIEEWNRHATPAKRDANGAVVTPGSDPYGGTGEWSFRRNGQALQKYWKAGIERMESEDIEGVVTLGMRGNGDVSLPDGDGIDLMESIIDKQREILAETSSRDITTIPQVQTLYKEVQRYWDSGYRPPDDVTVVFCDDNWGNMRKLPDQKLAQRSGGYGMYYHFDYVGDGRNYKWADTTNLASTWEQLNLTYTYGVDRLWVVNVGDMKNEELPLQLYLDYAWDPSSITPDTLDDWERRYVALNFGGTDSAEIADVLSTYGELQARRKPELLNRKITVDPAKDLSTDSSAVVYDDRAGPFSLTNYQEIERVTAEWQQLAARAQAVRARIPADQQDAYYQLVYYQVKATANLYELRLAQFRNIQYAQQGRAATNALADETEARFAEDQALSDYYNTQLADGKWNGFQTQPKIGYGDFERYNNASWQQPQTDDHVALPDALYPHLRRIDLPAKAEMAVAIDGSDQWWPNSGTAAVLPEFSPYQTAPTQFVEVFNRGSKPFTYRIVPGKPWVKVSRPSGRVTDQVRVNVTVDFAKAPKGTTKVPLTVLGPDGTRTVVTAVVDNPTPTSGKVEGFVEADGHVSIDAAHTQRRVGTGQVSWKTLPGAGRTQDAVTPWPVTAQRQVPGGSSPHLEYTVTLTSAGPVTVWANLSPRSNVLPTDGLKYAVSIDDGAPQVVDVIKATGANDTTMNRQWARNTSDNINRTATTHVVGRPGQHTVKFWMVDPTVVLQQLVIDTGGLRPSYLGPPESRFVGHGQR